MTRRLWQQAGGQVDSSLQYAADFELWRHFAEHAPLRVIDRQLSGFRLHSGQKSVALDRYYAEIDKRRGPVSAVWARLGQRSKLARSLERLASSAWARARADDGSVTLEQDTGRWILSR